MKKKKYIKAERFYYNFLDWKNCNRIEGRHVLTTVLLVVTILIFLIKVYPGLNYLSVNWDTLPYFPAGKFEEEVLRGIFLPFSIFAAVMNAAIMTAKRYWIIEIVLSFAVSGVIAYLSFIAFYSLQESLQEKELVYSFFANMTLFLIFSWFIVKKLRKRYKKMS